jgi:hypothetical protein
MTSATISLDKKTYPLMMHLSILSKHDSNDEPLNYDPNTQTSTFSRAMAGSWCTRAGSAKTGWTGMNWDEDSQEDD